MNWHGAARTNYVRIKDEASMERLVHLVEELRENEVYIHPDHPDQAMILGDDSGTFNLFSYSEDSEDADVELVWEKDVAPLLAQGEVLILMASAYLPLFKNSKLEAIYELEAIYGQATAITWDGRRVDLSLQDIYKQAARELQIPLDKLGKADGFSPSPNTPEQETLPDMDRPRA